MGHVVAGAVEEREEDGDDGAHQHAVEGGHAVGHEAPGVEAHQELGEGGKARSQQAAKANLGNDKYALSGK